MGGEGGNDIGGIRKLLSDWDFTTIDWSRLSGRLIIDGSSTLTLINSYVASSSLSTKLKAQLQGFGSITLCF